MASRKKRNTKQLASRRSPSPEISDGGGVVLWQNILIGFRGLSGSASGTSFELTGTARAAIEATFTEAALHYWTSVDWKSSIVPGGGSDVAGLAAFVTQQLNDGRKRDITLEFRAEKIATSGAASVLDGGVEAKSPPTRDPTREGVGSGRSLSSASTEDDPVLVEKPDDVFCWYLGPTLWIDDATFQLMVVTGSEGGAVSVPWRPDGLHPMLVRFVFDCPYAE
ncbi:MAG: hypothetical protein AB7I19_06885 [Planctomycetota bacterium]